MRISRVTVFLVEGTLISVRGSVHMCNLGRDDQSVVTDKSFSCCTDALLAISSQWYVSDACMSPIERPFRLAMADNESSWGGHRW